MGWLFVDIHGNDLRLGQPRQLERNQDSRRPRRRSVCVGNHLSGGEGYEDDHKELQPRKPKQSGGLHTAERHKLQVPCSLDDQSREEEVPRQRAVGVF